MSPGCCAVEEGRVVLVEAATHRREPDRNGPQRSIEPGRVDIAGGEGPLGGPHQRVCLLGDEVTELVARRGKRQVRRNEADASVCRGAVVRDPAVPFAGVSVRDAQCGDPAAPESAHCVEGLTGGDPRVAPRGPGADVARSLDDDSDVRAQHVFGGEQTGVQGDGLVLAAVGLADRHGADQPAVLGEGRDVAGERDRQGAAVGHQVDDPGTGPVDPDPGEDRRQGRVQVRDHHGHAEQVTGGGPAARHHRVVRTVLLVDGHEHLLLRRVAGLDDVALRGLGILGQPVGRHDDERQATRPEPAEQGRGVEQHPVTHLRLTHQGGVGQCADEVVLRAGDGALASQPHGILHRARPPATHLLDRSLTPLHHDTQTSHGAWPPLG
jgi:hypothetical protein